MRTIKFRGFNKKNGVWLYGFYLQNRGTHFVTPDEFANGKTWEDYEVEPESVGQFTGLTDKSGTPIYEGDIIGCDRPNIRHLVFYCEKEGRFKAALNGETKMSILGICGLEDRKWIATKEVIGNIFEDKFTNDKN